MTDETCQAQPPAVMECNFPKEELQELHRVAQRESVAFPKWAMGLLISILGALAASNGAVWLSFADRAPADKTATDLLDLDRRVLHIESIMPEDYPPKWFVAKVDSMLIMVNENNKLLNDLRIELAAIKVEKGKP